MKENSKLVQTNNKFLHQDHHTNSMLLTDWQKNICITSTAIAITKTGHTFGQLACFLVIINDTFFTLQLV